MLPTHQQVGLILFCGLSHIAIQKKLCESLCILALTAQSLVVGSVELQATIFQRLGL